jgi:hypothetical protein
MPYERGEIRPDPSTPGGWVEVMITQPYIGEQLTLGTIPERVSRKLVAIDPARVGELQAAGKFVVQAQANPDVWVTEE